LPHDQIYPTLARSVEIERVRRFGEEPSFASSAGDKRQVAACFMVLLAGKVTLTEHGYIDNPTPIIIHGPGNFTGELA
jgi:thioredoxin reductase (NADPH)